MTSLIIYGNQILVFQAKTNNILKEFRSKKKNTKRTNEDLIQGFYSL